MRQQVSSEIYQRQHKSFKKKHTMRGHDFNSSALKTYMMMDKDELHSDGEDADGSEPFESDGGGEEYFTGVFKQFVTGLQPSPEETKNAQAYSMSGLGGPSLTNLPKSYIERCKALGRLGPIKTQIDLSSAHGECAIGCIKARDFAQDSPTQPLKEMDGSEALALDVEAISSFVSVRANTAVFRHCYFYEVTLLTDGLMQIGWCSLNTRFTNQNGVGDSPNSYAYDGYRVEKWNE